MRRFNQFPDGHGPKVAAIGGGHGLAVTLRALRRVTDNITAVVGVSDDGGSSGRLRHEFGVLPPGDLRMALAALCGDDTWGRTWSRVVQHRFSGHGELRGHSLGNLLIMSLWEETGDVVAGLDWVAALLGAQGRVLPVSTEPLEIVAQVQFDDATSEVHGQVAVATSPGDVQEIHVNPVNPPACPEAVEAIMEADVITLGPGSWYTSVIAPLLVPGLRAAIHNSPAKLVLIQNLMPQPDETENFTPQHHLEVLMEQVPGLEIDTVIADPVSVRNPAEFRQACAYIGSTLLLQSVSSTSGRKGGTHDPDLLAAALSETTGRGSISTWR